MIRREIDSGFATLVVVSLAMMSCSADSPSSPSGPPGSPTVGNVFTIGASGVSPRMIEIQVGERVIFTNDDEVNHEMSSDEHPTHLDCQAINQVGFLRPGETRESGNFIQAKSCTFHDHLNSTSSTLQGTIVITE